MKLSGIWFGVKLSTSVNLRLAMVGPGISNCRADDNSLNKLHG